MTLEQACPSDYQRAQCAFKDSMTHGFCNSHYLSHFAAFFIDARAKRSVVESCFINFTNAFTIEGVCVKDKRIHARLGSRREEIYKVHRVFERVNF